ncbi:hypothetical protein DVB69_11355 [Sporosarcina sp. BI001-red]|uniref:LptM family lipoprotein n=1 Tax=Sporosarcina sp. BI001-red TaxID=2282866 RepID=UPI000E28854A|nr:hypothetical protein [Sporosarcina sp. BI001-red]REB07417.1 hypothetical protein DVB69_11355 [Sporosarcina sp. BI001-red]
MEKMKKAFLVLMMMIVAGALAACGDDTSKDKTTKPETEASEPGATEGDGEASSEDVDPTDPNFDKIIELLEAEGLEVGEKTSGFADIDGTTQVMNVVINGEDMLPFQVYMMKSDSENLKSAKDKGEVTMEFEGQSGQIPMEAKDDFLYFIADGHPDHDKIYDVMKNDFNQE